MVSPVTAAVSAVVELTAAMGNFTKGSLQAFSDFEKIKANLEIVTGSVLEASSTFNQLQEMARKSPFDVEGLANAAAQLRQTGTSAQELIPTLTLLGNVAGGSLEKFNRIVANFAQIASMGKAFAIDLRQFAMMGIPIYDMLNKIGVTGTATFEDVLRAFQLMAGEGGKFYNAMSKGAETLTGKITNLTGTWKNFKATLVETTGLDEVAKKILDVLIDTINQEEENRRNEREIAEARIATFRGTATEMQKLIDLEYELQKAQEQSDRNQRYYKPSTISHSMLSRMELNEEGVVEYNRVLSLVEKKQEVRIKQLQEELKIQKEIVNTIKEQERYLQGLANAHENFMASQRTMQEKIDIAYAKVQSNNLIEQIAYWRQKLAEMINILESDTSGLSSSGAGVESWGNVRKIEVIIAAFLEQLKKGRNKVKPELTDWQQLLKSAFSFNDTDVEKFLLVTQGGIDGLDKFIERLGISQEAVKKYGEVLGIDLAGSLEETVQSWQNVVSAIARSDIEWDEKVLLLEQAVQGLKKSKEESDDENFKNYLSNLRNERDLLSEINVERRIREQFNQNLIASGLNPSSDQQDQAWNERQLTMLKQLDEEIRLSRLTIKDEAIERLVVEKQITRELAEQYINFERQKNSLHGIAGIMQDIEEAMENATRTGNSGAYNGLQFAEAGMGVMQQSQVGNIASSAMEGASVGGPWGAAIGAFLSIIEEVMGSMENLNIVLNPIVEVTEELQPLVKSLLLPIAIINRLINKFIKFISPVIEFFFGDMADMYDTIAGTNDERERELEQLRALNDQYTKLRNSIQEMEEYYLKKRRELYADWGIETVGVNDMILTPHGNFSTDPNDYIIATKNPSALGGGTVVNITVHNEAGDVASATATQTTGPNGTEIAIMVRKIVANDIATGKLDGAFNAKQARDSGRRVTG
jgi:hypothetical protein